MFGSLNRIQDGFIIDNQPAGAQRSRDEPSDGSSEVDAIDPELRWEAHKSHLQFSCHAAPIPDRHDL